MWTGSLQDSRFPLSRRLEVQPLCSATGLRTLKTPAGFEHWACWKGKSHSGPRVQKVNRTGKRQGPWWEARTRDASCWRGKVVGKRGTRRLLTPDHSSSGQPTNRGIVTNVSSLLLLFMKQCLQYAPTPFLSTPCNFLSPIPNHSISREAYNPMNGFLLHISIFNSFLQFNFSMGHNAVVLQIKALSLALAFHMGASLSPGHPNSDLPAKERKKAGRWAWAPEPMWQAWKKPPISISSWFSYSWPFEK